MHRIFSVAATLICLCAALARATPPATPGGKLVRLTLNAQSGPTDINLDALPNAVSEMLFRHCTGPEILSAGMSPVVPTCTLDGKLTDSATGGLLLAWGSVPVMQYVPGGNLTFGASIQLPDGSVVGAIGAGLAASGGTLALNPSSAGALGGLRDFSCASGQAATGVTGGAGACGPVSGLQLGTTPTTATPGDVGQTALQQSQAALAQAQLAAGMTANTVTWAQIPNNMMWLASGNGTIYGEVSDGSILCNGVTCGIAPSAFTKVRLPAKQSQWIAGYDPITESQCTLTVPGQIVDRVIRLYDTSVTTSKIGIQVKTAGVGSIIEVGLRADSGSGTPGNLIVDSGPMSTTTAGPVFVTLPSNLVLLASTYWEEDEVVAVGSTPATVYSVANDPFSLQVIQAPSLGALFGTNNSYVLVNTATSTDALSSAPGTYTQANTSGTGSVCVPPIGLWALSSVP